MKIFDECRSYSNQSVATIHQYILLKIIFLRISLIIMSILYAHSIRTGFLIYHHFHERFIKFAVRNFTFFPILCRYKFNVTFFSQYHDGYNQNKSNVKGRVWDPGKSSVPESGEETGDSDSKWSVAKIWLFGSLSVVTAV